MCVPDDLASVAVSLGGAMVYLATAGNGLVSVITTVPTAAGAGGNGGAGGAGGSVLGGRTGSTSTQSGD